MCQCSHNPFVSLCRFPLIVITPDRRITDHKHIAIFSNSILPIQESRCFVQLSQIYSFGVITTAAVAFHCYHGRDLSVYQIDVLRFSDDVPRVVWQYFTQKISHSTYYSLFSYISLSHFCTYCYPLIVRMLISTTLSFRYAFSFYANPCFLRGCWWWGLGRAVLFGRVAVLADYPWALPVLNTFYVDSFVFRKIRLASVGNTAVSRGSRNPSLWIMIRFLGDKGRRLSTRERRLDLRFFNLRLLQSLNFIFPFNTFNIHSLILLGDPCYNLRWRPSLISGMRF
jgi:hypothetical protein